MIFSAVNDFSLQMPSVISHGKKFSGKKSSPYESSVKADVFSLQYTDFEAFCCKSVSGFNKVKAFFRYPVLFKSGKRCFGTVNILSAENTGDAGYMVHMSVCDENAFISSER